MAKRLTHEPEVFEGFRFCPACSEQAKFMVEPEACQERGRGLLPLVLWSAVSRRGA